MKDLKSYFTEEHVQMSKKQMKRCSTSQGNANQDCSELSLTVIETAKMMVQFSSFQYSCSVVSNSLGPHDLQHSRLPCSSQTPRVYSNSCPWSWWCDLAISSSIIPFSSSPQSLPASGSFPMSQLFAWGGQSIGVSASTSVLSMNTQAWSPLG